METPQERNQLASIPDRPNGLLGELAAFVKAHGELLLQLAVNSADLARIANGIERIADALAPAPAAIVDSRYVADRLGCTVVWIAEMVRNGRIPKSCVVVGTGNGKPWKFHRRQIDEWLKTR